MAFTTFVTTMSMVAIASAGWPAWPNNGFPFSGFGLPMLRFGPITPPAIPPPFPRQFYFPTFPTFPTFPPIPSVADIVKRGSLPGGGSFSGVIVSSKSQSKVNEDGTITKEHGSTVVTNDNGEVTIHKTGNAPPDLPIDDAPSRLFDEPKIKPSLNNLKKFNAKILQGFNFGRHQLFETLDPEKIKSHVPEKNENYIGSSYIFSHSSTNNNGQVKEAGSVEIVENNNGDVKHFRIPYNKDGIPKEE